MIRVELAAPQFLVDDVLEAARFYEQRLGFAVDFVYEGFYASSRACPGREPGSGALRCVEELEARELAADVELRVVAGLGV